MNEFVPKNKSYIKESELKAQKPMTEQEKIERAQKKLHKSPTEALADQSFKELNELRKEKRERDNFLKAKEKQANDPLFSLGRENLEVENSLGIKQARILMNENQHNTVNRLMVQARENVYCEEVAERQRAEIKRRRQDGNDDDAQSFSPALRDLYLQAGGDRYFEDQPSPREEFLIQRRKRQEEASPLMRNKSKLDYKINTNKKGGTDQGKFTLKPTWVSELDNQLTYEE